jgi:hypothetical protein
MLFSIRPSKKNFMEGDRPLKKFYSGTLTIIQFNFPIPLIKSLIIKTYVAHHSKDRFVKLLR